MTSLLKELKHDLPASIVVFFVAVPLCLGIALASGAPLFAGLIAGIIDTSRSKVIDFDVREILRDFTISAPARDITVELRGHTLS